MNDSPTHSEFFRDGGALLPDIPSYIERPADAQLRECVKRGDFAYVLAPRQMGKSSLMAKVVAGMRERGENAAIIDLTKLGESTGTDAASWYRSLLHEVARQLNIEINIKEWWEQREGVTCQQRFYEFFADVALPACSGKITVFVDEIDSTIPLSFSDDFFAGIRALYNARATEPAFNRLGFVLLGVATPDELISDTRRTPFNIGTAIELTDFTIEETAPLVNGLGVTGEEGRAILERILYWTGGHPYLTQKTCRNLTMERAGGSAKERLDKLVEKLFFAAGARSTEHNLSFVTKRILGSPYRQNLLALYKKVLAGKKVSHDPRSVVQAAIKLCGLLCVGEGNTLRIRNNVYRRVVRCLMAA